MPAAGRNLRPGLRTGERKRMKKFLIGGYAQAGGNGILSAGLDTEKGKLTAVPVCTELENPSWILMHPDRNVLYAVEELVRDLAHKYKCIYICCGPIVTDTTLTIGTVRKIVVPQSFYKVLLRSKQDGTWTSIGFVMPNAAGNRPLMTYMLSVGEVEQLTDIDFFPQLPDSVENIIEADFTVADWTL